MNDPRTDELAANLSAVRERIAADCAALNRPMATLIVVTKFFDAQDVHRLAGLGVTDVGENRDQEASGKRLQCADLDLTWHFIGQLQTNKAKSVVGYADLVHTVDRASLVKALDRAAAARGKVQDVLVQVNLDPVPAEARGGVDPHGFLELVEAVAAAEALRMRGVMGVAPLGQDPEPAFAKLAQMSASLQTHVPGADIVSAGMSSDMEVALSYGATHLRIGTAVMGSRPDVRYRQSQGGTHNKGEAQ